MSGPDSGIVFYYAGRLDAAVSSAASSVSCAHWAESAHTGVTYFKPTRPAIRQGGRGYSLHLRSRCVSFEPRCKTCQRSSHRSHRVQSDMHRRSPVWSSLAARLGCVPRFDLPGLSQNLRSQPWLTSQANAFGIQCASKEREASLRRQTVQCSAATGQPQPGHIG